MEVFFKSSFIKDFKKLPDAVKKEVKKICILTFPEIDSLFEFRDYPLQKIRGFKIYYRIKIGNFRIGFKKFNNEIVFMRVLDRKDIYRYFP